MIPLKHTTRNDLQAFAVVRFIFHYALPVGVFAFCYGSIFHTIRRQSKVVTGHVGQDATMATTSRDQNPGQVQQQATGAMLSRTEMNVLKTMITVIICFMLFWGVPAIANLLTALGVCMYTKQYGVQCYAHGTRFTNRQAGQLLNGLLILRGKLA